MIEFRNRGDLDKAIHDIDKVLSKARRLETQARRMLDRLRKIHHDDFLEVHERHPGITTLLAKRAKRRLLLEERANLEYDLLRSIERVHESYDDHTRARRVDTRNSDYYALAEHKRTYPTIDLDRIRRVL